MSSHPSYLYLCLILLSFWACEPKGNSEEEFDSPVAALDHKQLPFDMSSFQRAYPDKTFDVNGYKAAFSEALSKHAEKSVLAPDGFDAPWTTQGPGNIGARINIIEIDPNNEQVIYIGFSGGGVWKTTNDGATWAPIFDAQPYLSIGAIEVDPANSNIVYVGTGDPNITGYPFIGNGVYKSTNGGTTWTQIGLANTGVISKIIVDPTNSNTVYASAMGNPFAKGLNRGLYKSTNGGSSWTKVLYISDQAGVIDMVLNPNNPNIIFATGWDRIRTNQQSIIYGNGARVYRSTNGGITWSILTNGLPIKQLSRINLAMSPDNPNVLYASVVDSTFYPQGIYKTENGGDSWTAVTEGNSDNGLVNPFSNFGWYFARIFIRPGNDQTAFLLGVRLWSTPNSGGVWSVLPPLTGANAPHVDNHYMAFNSNGDIYLATDGGLYKNPVGTQQWQDKENIAATQVYRIGFNPHTPAAPYYGGCQDNGTVRGNAGSMNNWERVFGADGFQPVFHPTDPNKIYYETQNGNIFRTTDGVSFQSYIAGISQTDRIHWDMQYIMSAHNPEVLYTGTHRVYRHNPASSPNWIPISNDLTDGNIYGANFHTITTVHESPVDANVLYAGTTDGNVWRSTNAGTNWTAINSGLPDRYVTCIKADPNNPNGVYVAHSGYRYNEVIPHIHYSANQGATWVNISADLPQLGINHIEVMPNNNGNVIFVATDAGVYATLNGGNSWDRLGTAFPFVTTYDLDLNLDDNLLIAGTFGRSILTFPLDEIGVSLTPPASANIAGGIQTIYGKLVNEVQVSLSGGSTNNTATDLSGAYQFNALATGQSITVTPGKDINPRNGVTGFDIVAMKRQILQVDTLGPYDLIAADINSNGVVTSYDVVLLTKLILEIDNDFAFNTSWRFVRGNYVFPNPLSPFPFPETINYNPLTASQFDADFIAVKIGDVNNSVNSSQFNGAEEKSFGGALNFEMQNQQIRKGESITVSLTTNEFTDLLGYQFTLQFDEKTLEFQSAATTDLDGIGEQVFGERHVKNGQLTTLWTNALPVSMDKGTEVMRIHFVAKADGQLKELLTINSMHTTQEAYRGEGTLLEPVLNWTAATATTLLNANTDITMGQNIPNPLKKGGTSRITFNLPEATTASFELYDPFGKLIWSTNQNYPAGSHEVELKSELFTQSGVYLYHLKTKTGQSCTKRMLYLE
jgi:photosystem II stability/assembly factor-like uncharacterized protein